MYFSKEKIPLAFRNIFQNHVLSLQFLLLPLCIYHSSMPVPTLNILDEVSETSILLYVMEFSLCMVRFVDATKITFPWEVTQCKPPLCLCLFCLLKFVPKSLSLKLYIFWNILLYGISYLTVSWGCFFGSKSVSQEPFFLSAPSEKRRAKPSAYHKAVPPQRKD